MADYLVYRELGKLELALHDQNREEDLLIRGFVPGEDMVVIPDVWPGGGVREQAEMYFRGEDRDRERIDCWVAGALQRQACLEPQ